MAKIAANQYTVTDLSDGSIIWTTTTAPVAPNYTFTISNLTGAPGTEPKIGDSILYSYYRYTISSIASTTVLAPTRVSIRGTTGATGRALTGVTEYYLATSASTDVTRSTSGWKTTVQSTTPTNKYLWNYEKLTWSVAPLETFVEPFIIGIHGDKGDKGDTGAQGPQGIQGPPGSNGQSLYTWVKYADNASGGGMSDSPAGKKYIGLAYNKTTATESSTVGDYTWSLIQGPQGIQGPDGSNGESLYTWIKYADTPTTGMNDSPTGKKYLGIAYNKTTATESTSYGDYSWSLIEGPQGTAGVSITSVDVEYGKSSSATTAPTSWSTAAPTWEAGKYIWSRTKTTYSAGNPTYTNPACITGQAGQTGRGVASIVEQYAISSSKTTAPSNASFSTAMPTWSPGQYIWSRSLITYTSGSPATSTTTPIVSSEWEAVNDVQVGGRNLIPAFSSPRWTIGPSFVFDTPYYARLLAGVSASSGCYVSIDVTENTDYIYSFNSEYGRSSISGWIDDEQQGTLLPLVNNTSVRIFNSGNCNRVRIAISRYSAWVSDEATYYNLKLERGNKATDWTPAPEDIDGRLDEIDEKATKKSEMIFVESIAERNAQLPLDFGTIVFVSENKTAYRYGGKDVDSGEESWSAVTESFYGDLGEQLSAVQGQLGTKAMVHTGPNAPESAQVGDLWINTSKNNEISILFGNNWMLFNQSEFESMEAILDTIIKTMTGGNSIWRQETAPVDGLTQGDLWFNTTPGQNNACKKYIGNSWVNFDFTTILDYIESKSEDWKDSDELYAWVKESTAYKDALNSKLNANIYYDVIHPELLKIPGLVNAMGELDNLSISINEGITRDQEMLNKLEAFNVYLEYQEATGGAGTDYLRIARLDPGSGNRSGFEIRVTNQEIGFYHTEPSGATTKLAYINGLEFRMVNASVTKQINLIPSEAALGEVGGKNYFQLLSTDTGAFQGLWITET